MSSQQEYYQCTCEFSSSYDHRNSNTEALTTLFFGRYLSSMKLSLQFYFKKKLTTCYVMLYAVVLTYIYKSECSVQIKHCPAARGKWILIAAAGLVNYVLQFPGWQLKCNGKIFEESQITDWSSKCTVRNEFLGASENGFLVSAWQ